jgi:hypothetical protein
VKNTTHLASRRDWKRYPQYIVSIGFVSNLRDIDGDPGVKIFFVISSPIDTFIYGLDRSAATRQPCNLLDNWLQPACNHLQPDCIFLSGSAVATVAEVAVVVIVNAVILVV